MPIGTPKPKHAQTLETKMAETPSTTEEEFYDEATEAFPSVADLVPLADNKNPTTTGRLVAIWALSNGTEQGENGPYPITESITLVLDDGPDGDQSTDLIGPAPVELPLRHSTTGIQSRLAPRVEGMSKPRRAEDGTILAPAVPLKFRPMLGRVNTRPSTKYKKGSPAVSIAKPTDEDRAIVKRYEADIRAINKRLEEKAAAVADAAAFDE